MSPLSTVSLLVVSLSKTLFLLRGTVSVSTSMHIVISFFCEDE
jgi:hypothetical protein